jgi:hypothetical protein
MCHHTFDDFLTRPSGPGNEQQTAGIITTPLLLASTGMSTATKECKISGSLTLPAYYSAAEKLL